MSRLTPLNIKHLNELIEKDERTPCGLRKNSVLRARKIMKILEKCNFKCSNCGSSKDLTIEHFKGREFAKHNNHQKYKLSKCIVLCVKCHEEKNRRKNDILPYPKG